jgi:hypothetical protein
MSPLRFSFKLRLPRWAGDRVVTQQLQQIIDETYTTHTLRPDSEVLARMRALAEARHMTIADATLTPIASQIAAGHHPTIGVVRRPRQ